MWSIESRPHAIALIPKFHKELQTLIILKCLYYYGKEN